MADIITMPKLSDTMEEGAIADWLIKEGEELEEGAAFVEIETDKATMEYNAPVGGIVLKILVAKSKPCALGAPILVVGAAGESWEEALKAHSSLATKLKVAKESPPAYPTKSAPSKTPTEPPKKPVNERVKASPYAKKLAREQGLDLSNVQGTGPLGRILSRDLSQLGHPEAKHHSAPLQNRSDQLVPLTMMRKTIAKRLSQAKNEAPHFYLTISVGMDSLNAWREQLNKVGDHPKVSVNDLIVLCLSRALQKHPNINASFEGEHVRHYAEVHIALAVALESGLVTPVLRHAQNLGLREICAQSKDLIVSARQGNLKNEDFMGGTFTLSNLGMFGIEEFTAIINPPQAAILAVGGAVDTPVVKEGQIKIESRLKMTLSCDHRVIDGAMGAQFLKTLKSYIESPLMILA